MQRWARSSSSQSPYPSLPAYAKSSLIPMLGLSPQKPLRWVFVGASKLSVFSHANWSYEVGQGLEGPAANVAAAGLERRGSGSGASGKILPSTTPILHPRSQMRGSKGRCRHRPLRTAGYGALSRRLSPLVAHLTNDSRPSNFALTDKVGHHKHFFFSTVHGAFSF